MKRLYRHCNWTLIMVITIVFSACKRFVDVPPPITTLVTASVFSDAGAATSAQTSIYTQMFNNSESFNMALSCGLLSDELKNYSSAPANIEYYQNAMISMNNPGCWKDAYNYIYQCNAVLEGLNGNSSINNRISNQLIGEAEFVRAFWDFYLVNSYGNVPLVNTSNYSVNATIVRTSKGAVYSQIVSDLEDAQNVLNTNFVDGTDTAITTTDRGRPTKWAAAAMLARVFLYLGKYDSAEMESSSVIGNTQLFNIVQDLNNVFLVNSQEAIWQNDLPLPNYAQISTPDGAGFILVAGPMGEQTISSQLLNSFEQNDARYANWINAYIDSTVVPNVKYYYPYKYKIFSGPSNETVMMLRLAEQYLIRAEARAMQNNIQGAQSDLNVIRARANLPPTSANSQSDLLTAILHERQVELFTEWGNRWFDLIRTNNANSVMGVVTPLKGGSWSPNWQLFPIPQNDIRLNVNLTQNTGY